VSCLIALDDCDSNNAVGRTADWASSQSESF